MVSLRSDLAGTTRGALNGAFRATVVATLFFICLGFAHAQNSDALLNRFLDSQKNVKTWSADFIQTRTSKSFTRPLTSEGHVWFSAPNKFRWELGQPAKTIAVRAEDSMLVIYPKLKRVEKFSLNAQAAGQWKDMLALLEAGFPRDRAELESQFRIQPLNIVNDVAVVGLEPKSATARKMMPLVRIGFSTKDFLLASTEMQFADGSTMRNDFKNGKVNEALDQNIFAPRIESDYKVIEPLKK